MSSEKQIHAGAPAVAPSQPKRESGEEHIDRVETNADDMDEKKPIEDVEGRDHTGATKKTDPEEIKLVRKLDLRIMVS